MIVANTSLSIPTSRPQSPARCESLPVVSEAYRPLRARPSADLEALCAGWQINAENDASHLADVALMISTEARRLTRNAAARVESCPNAKAYFVARRSAIRESDEARALLSCLLTLAEFAMWSTDARCHLRGPAVGSFSPATSHRFLALAATFFKSGESATAFADAVQSMAEDHDDSRDVETSPERDDDGEPDGVAV